VLDATAGLGYDAFLIAATGRTVVAVERCEPVFRLLAEAHRRAAADPGSARAAIAGRITVVRGDVRECFGELGAWPEAIYLDPMFPPKRRAAALPPKEMQVVRALAGDDPDAEGLLEAARARGVRVILKRPRHAPEGRCDFAIGGKLARFEVYLPKGPIGQGTIGQAKVDAQRPIGQRPLGQANFDERRFGQARVDGACEDGADPDPRRVAAGGGSDRSWGPPLDRPDPRLEPGLDRPVPRPLLERPLDRPLDRPNLPSVGG
jgi:hypothetical protein